MATYSSWSGFRFPALVGLLAVCSCGLGGESGGAGGSIGGGIGNLGIIEHSPSDDGLQVPVDTTIEISFDGPVDALSVHEDDISLTVGPGAPIPGTFTTKQGDTVVVFTPANVLAKATDYTLTLQPTLCDKSFRTLDMTYSFRFRTFDDVPPTLRSASVSNNETGVTRTIGFALNFDEDLDSTSINSGTVAIKDIWGTPFEADITSISDTIGVTPYQDLPGERRFVISARGGPSGLRDRSGNPLAQNWSVQFTTAADTTPPTLTGSDPGDGGSGVSPRARLEYTFSESMDPDSYEPTGLVLENAFHNPIEFTLSTSRDKKVVRLMPTAPLVPHQAYAVRFISGATGLTDVSGNSLTTSITKSFFVGLDTTGPNVATAVPSSGAVRVSPNVQFELFFNEPVKNATVSRVSVVLTGDSGSVYITPTISHDGNKLLVTPGATLAQSEDYVLRLVSGYDGIRDRAGNPMAQDFTLEFTTSVTAELPVFRISPMDSSAAVASTSKIAIVASGPVDPTTVTDTSITVKEVGGNHVMGDLRIDKGNRAIVFEPRGTLPGGKTIRVTIGGGASGVRLANGNWTTAATTSTFRTGFHFDSIPPELKMTVNEISALRNEGLVVPPYGFAIDLSFFDTGSSTVDPTSLFVQLSGPGSVPTPAALFGLTTFSASQASVQIDHANALATGTYTVAASIRDLSGNLAKTKLIKFTVADANPDVRPFERTQIVRVMFDSDRERGGKGNGQADFDEDLIDLGLMATGDPVGTNARMRQLVTDGVLRIANELFGRAPNGARKDGSVSVRLVTRKPCGAPHMKIAVGGMDPQGSQGRGYGDPSTGVLGRALFDYRNSRPNENNAGTSPGLGVFVGELFLYQARLYLDLYPHYLTIFGRTYRGLSPHMGGTPAGTHALDATVLAVSFNYNQATPNERVRYNAIMKAADDLAKVTGIVLVHEIGHSLGLVAPGMPSAGLHGDLSLHNASTGITDVMSAVIGYESMVSVKYAFRPLNLAYLREAVLLK